MRWLRTMGFQGGRATCSRAWQGSSEGGRLGSEWRWGTGAGMRPGKEIPRAEVPSLDDAVAGT